MTCEVLKAKRTRTAINNANRRMEYEFLLIIAKLVNGTNFSLVAFRPEFFQWVALREKDVFHLRIENGIF